MQMPAAGSTFPFGHQVFVRLVETVEDYAICALDVQGRVVHWNHGAVRTLGYSEAEVLGRSLAFLFTEEDQQAGIPAQELRIAAELGKAEDERWHRRKDGSRFWAVGLLVAVKAPDGNLIGFGKIMRDRTGQREVQETLRNRARALAAADADKNIFLATLAHELRNPLTALLSGAALLGRSPAPDRIQWVAEMIERQGSLAKRLVDDLLDIARVERGKLPLERTQLDLRDVVRHTMEGLASATSSGDYTLTVELPDSPLMVCADPHRMQQILTNLLNNAMKFTGKGGRIAITAISEGHEAVVRVIDSGIGIPPDKLASIFDLFSQVHPALPGAQAGLGIGLALTRELVNLHGGSIQVSSAGPGRGSEFLVRIPLFEGQQGIRE
jgi:PAS domain S-box-containing protein